MSPTGARRRVIRDYVRQYPDPIRATAGTLLEVGRDDPEHPGWRWCTAPDGRDGWVPAELLEYRFGHGAVLTSDYSAVELTVRAGQEVVVDEERAGWLRVRTDAGERGWIPRAAVSP